MDDPVPVRRWLLGCLTIALLVGAVMLLVRPTIFTLAPPRDDSAVVVAAASELGAEPLRRDVILSRAYGWAGEIDAGDGRVQLTLLVTRPPSGAATAVNAASRAGGGCAVDPRGDRLTDCDGRTWTFDGLPIEAAGPLERFPVTVEAGSVLVDLTRSVED